VKVANVTLYEYASEQLRNLYKVVGFGNPDANVLDLLRELLGAAGARPLSDGPLWPSDVSDDATPIEFSVAFDETGGRAIRVLGETIAENPSLGANTDATRQVLAAVADRFGLPLDRYHAVADLFLPGAPRGKFALWYSLILRPDSRPQLKIYFNPEVHGRGTDRELVATALRRLGLDKAYEIVEEHALRRGALDRFSFFALDLNDDPLSRVKLYVSHDSASSVDVERAGRAVDGVDPERIREFCEIIGGGTGPFGGRPLVSSYSFVGDGTGRPGNYSLYVPIRDYVPDDETARSRVLEFMKRRNLDEAELDQAVGAVTQRQLAAGVGLIAHVSLRLGRFGSGTTLYLSSEAFTVTPPSATA
jgi:DMATS type aromatic prenyltransferase